MCPHERMLSQFNNCQKPSHLTVRFHSEPEKLAQNAAERKPVRTYDYSAGQFDYTDKLYVHKRLSGSFNVSYVAETCYIKYYSGIS